MGTMNSAFVITQGLLEVSKNKFPYHGTKHTLMVMAYAKKICFLAGISEYMTSLVLSAAAWHDAVHGYGQAKDVLESAQLAGESMKQFGYRDDEITIVQGLVRGTETWTDLNGRMHQLAEFKGKLEKILADADLCYLGANKSDFVDMSLRRMAEVAGKPVCELSQTELRKGWEDMLQFILDHKWLTREAMDLVFGGIFDNMAEVLQRRRIWI